MKATQGEEKSNEARESIYNRSYEQNSGIMGNSILKKEVAWQ